MTGGLIVLTLYIMSGLRRVRMGNLSRLVALWEVQAMHWLFHFVLGRHGWRCSHRCRVRIGHVQHLL